MSRQHSQAVGRKGSGAGNGMFPGAKAAAKRPGCSSPQVPIPASRDGGPRGVPPRSKNSTMIMRPPQQEQGGQRSAVVPSASAVGLPQLCRAPPADQPSASRRRSAPWLVRCWRCSRHLRAAHNGGCGEIPWAGRGAGSAFSIAVVSCQSSSSLLVHFPRVIAHLSRGSRFSPRSAQWPPHDGVRRRGGTI